MMVLTTMKAVTQPVQVRSEAGTDLIMDPLLKHEKPNKTMAYISHHMRYVMMEIHLVVMAVISQVKLRINGIDCRISY